ncbi:MAG: thermonuclease family protein [Methylobacteriaceae bacterium]|jgi:endonuclease YncB( thermonuclease family)|nr:thermonuclease family protein [Methylobacteriaceae bacterium]
MRLLKALKKLVIVCGLFAGMAYVLQYYYFSRPRRIEGPPRYVSDGDTLNYGHYRVRLYGIDAPELDQYCSSAEGENPCGRTSRDALSGLAKNKPLRCEVKATDKYGRPVAVCIDTSTNTDIAAEMVRNGWAISAGAYRKEQREARAASRGLWSMEFEKPKDWRARKNASFLDRILDRIGLFRLPGRIWDWLFGGRGSRK